MKKYTFLLLGSFLVSASFGQKFTASVDAQLAIPQGEYKEVNPDAGFGIRANFMYRPIKDAPMKIGVELGMQEKGAVRQYFSGYVYGYYDEFEVSAGSNIFSLMFLARFQSQKLHKIKPFIDLTAGWNVFFSTVTVSRVTYYSQYDDSYSNSSKGRWALAYGASGGVDIPLNKSDELGLELKCTYLIGTNTQYLTNPYIDNDGNASFEEKESRTNMLIPQAGIRISIH
jgi:hypothetical protein